MAMGLFARSFIKVLGEGLDGPTDSQRLTFPFDIVPSPGSSYRGRERENPVFVHTIFCADISFCYQLYK